MRIDSIRIADAGLAGPSDRGEDTPLGRELTGQIARGIVMRACSICARPDADEINSALTSGNTQADVVRRWELSKPALQRHCKHLPKKARGGPKVAKTTAPAIENLTPAELDEMEARCLAVIESETDHRTRLMAIQRWQGIREVKLRLQSNDTSLSAAAFANHPAMVAIVDSMVDVLATHPAALADVLRVWESTVGTPLEPRVCASCSGAIEPTTEAH